MFQIFSFYFQINDLFYKFSQPDSTTTTENFREPPEQGLPFAALGASDDTIRTSVENSAPTEQHGQRTNSPLQQLDISEVIVISDSSVLKNQLHQSRLSHLSHLLQYQMMKVNHPFVLAMTMLAHGAK